MPLTLTETPGAADANTFATVAEYQAYWATRIYNTTQLAATEEQIKAALIWAGRLLNGLFSWTGSPVDDVQAMTWPRSGMKTRNGYDLATTVVPQDLKDAQCEWAGQLIVSDLTGTNSILQQGITSLKAGPVALTFKDQESFDAVRRAQPELAYLSNAVPDAVRNLLVPSWYTRELITQPFIFEAL